MKSYSITGVITMKNGKEYTWEKTVYASTLKYAIKKASDYWKKSVKLSFKKFTYKSHFIIGYF
jgi:hypothetical protein